MNRIATVSQAAERWAKDLTDVTGRNRLLFYRDLKVGTLNLTNAEPGELARLLSSVPGKQIRLGRLFSGPGFTHQDLTDDAVKRARAISRKGLENFEERGISTLFIVRGMASWTTEASSAKPAAPVLMCPLGLHRRGASEADFDLSLDGEWTVNGALLQSLAREFGIEASSEDLLGSYLADARLDDDEVEAIFDDLSNRASRIPDFAIQRQRMLIGNFMYKKMPMVNDLRNNLEVLAQNDIVSAIAGDEDARTRLRRHHTHSVDPSRPDSIPPADEFLVLDADSSQNKAINAALAGESFVLQGPPGTGKSQTIANLVATMMARGRSVLFVAEKRAAIDAVVKRLTKVDLDDFVMDLHGGTISRRELARQLDHTLTKIGQIPRTHDQDLHDRLEDSRAELSGYAKALHEQRDPWGRSLFDVQNRLLELESNPPRSPAAETLQFSSATIGLLDEETSREVQRDLSDWSDLGEPLISRRSPWTGAQVSTEDDVTQVMELLLQLDSAARAEQAAMEELLAELKFTDPGSLDAWAELLGLLSELDDICSHLSVDVFEEDLDGLVSNLAPMGRGRTSRALAQLFNGRYRASKREVASLNRKQAKLRASVALELVSSAREASHQWRELGRDRPPPVPSGLEKAIESCDETTQHLDELASFLPDIRFGEQTHGELIVLIRELMADQRTLNRMPRLAEIEDRVADAGLAVLLDLALSGELEPGELVATFELAWLRSIRRAMLITDRRLGTFDGQRHDRHLERFRSADNTHLHQSPARIRRQVAEHAIDACNSHANQNSLIRREANKKTRHVPLRTLFERAPDVLTAVRPCWAMSPLDVAQTLPPRPLFDLVIFDEASQVLPCDAISALMRAERAMVAGDSRQLPPTTFFDGSGKDDEDEEDEGSLTVFESILDVMDSLLSRRTITWHYRSQDERLIAFSNHQIYHGGLTTFPGASSATCVNFELVQPGQGEHADTRSHPAEVRRVVELMIDHALERPDETLGVIAMGQYHANRIEEALRRRVGQETSPELEAFFDEMAEERAFVKNLERVQGDERDAIILSVGYGKNSDGRLMYRFGPLNAEGGERRLNVAVTRARRRMTVVSSFPHTEVDPNRSSAQGVQHLRSFLRYAESGGVDLPGADGTTPLNPFEADVLDKLTAAGLDVLPQYGCSGYRIDFAVRHPTQPGRFALAVEADGASYHSSPTARDRDRLRQDHLERLGWRFCRIWSTDWFSDHAREVDRVMQAYRRALAEIDSEKTAMAPTARDNDKPEKAVNRVPSQGRGPLPLIPQGLPIHQHNPAVLVLLAQWVMSDGLLRTDEQVFEEMFARMGYRNRGKRIREALYRAIKQAKSTQRTH
ncbi:MAG: AAA domain-containing protein [Gemmatimonadota bacterium]|nr:AAA domain-containing protein [Gemmatimonadota bacterium]